MKKISPLLCLQFKILSCLFFLSIFSPGIYSLVPPNGPGNTYTTLANECWDANNRTTPYVYDTLTIAHTITICAGANAGNPGLFFKVKNTMTINAGASIDTSGSGPDTGLPAYITAVITWVSNADRVLAAPPAGNNLCGYNTPIRLCGTYDAQFGSLEASDSTRNGVPAADSGFGWSAGAGGVGATAMNAGSSGGTGGGAGGKSGAIVYIEAKSFQNDGDIHTNGAVGSAGGSTPVIGRGGGGGGGGGAIYIKAKLITNTVTGFLDSQGGMGGVGGTPSTDLGINNAVDQGGDNIDDQHKGGNGGRGLDGPIILIYQDDVLSSSNGLLLAAAPAAAPYTSNLVSAERHVFRDNNAPDDNPVVFDYASFLDATQELNSWITLKGTFDINAGTIAQPYWATISGLVTANPGPAEEIKYFDISKVQYEMRDPAAALIGGIHELCNTFNAACGAAAPTSSKVDDVSYQGTAYNMFNPTIPTLYGLDKFAPFDHPDGTNNFRLLSSQHADVTSQKDLNLFIDQHAPCDDTTNHNCTVTFEDTGAVVRTYTGIDDRASALNSSSFHMKMVINEGATGVNKGAGIINNGTAANIKVLLLKQTGTTVTAEAGAFDAVTYPPLKDKSCETLQQGGEAWNSHAGNFHTYNYLNPVLDLDSTGAAAALKTGVESLLTTSCTGGNLCEGTIWFLVCLQDNAGNWSSIIDKNDTAYWGGATPANYKGPDRPFQFHELDPAQPGLNHATNLIAVHTPSLYHRVIFDSPVPITDAGCSSGSDPCIAPVLAPAPAYVETAETNVRVAYDKIPYGSTLPVRIGVKMPVDTSGIKGLYYKKAPTSSPPVTNTDGTYVLKSTGGLSCAPVEAANSAPAGWVDFCFDLLVAPAANDVIFIWFDDFAGNNGWETMNGVAIRKLFYDAVAPPIVTSVNFGDDPTSDFTPTVTFDAPTDAESFIKDYKICFWDTDAGFNQGGLNALTDGDCPVGGGTDVTGFSHAGVIVAHDTAQTQQTVELPTFPAVGDYDVAVYARDAGGNWSEVSSKYDDLRVVLPTSTLDFTAQNAALTGGGVDPGNGVSGATYIFKIRYTDTANLPPTLATDAQVFIDINMNDVYEAGESFNMLVDGTAAPIDQDGNYINGEVYTFSKVLNYIPDSDMKMNYRFQFRNTNGLSRDGAVTGNPIIDNILEIDPYDPNSFDGLIQVRNNVVRPGSRYFPTIIMKSPGSNATVINVTIYDNSGRLIKRVINGRPFSTVNRYTIWKLDTESGQPVGSGVYNVVFQFGGGDYVYKKVVVIR